MLGLLSRFGLGPVSFVEINGQVGVETAMGDAGSVFALDVRDGRIASIFAVLNPDKLTRVAPRSDPRAGPAPPPRAPGLPQSPSSVGAASGGTWMVWSGLSSRGTSTGRVTPRAGTVTAYRSVSVSVPGRGNQGAGLAMPERRTEAISMDTTSADTVASEGSATAVTIATATDTVSAQRLVQAAVELADPGDGDWDITDALYTLTLHTVEFLGVDAAGVLLADEHGKLETVASSHEDTRLLELFQLQTDEGPCVDCFRDGRPVSSTDLDDDLDRWPTFIERARKDGLSSVHAVPMTLGGTVVGALNLFRCNPGALDDAQLAIAASFATATTIAIKHLRARRSKDRLAEQLQHALDSRVVIEQAKGYLARRNGEATRPGVRSPTHLRTHPQHCVWSPWRARSSPASSTSLDQPLLCHPCG